MFDLQQHVRDQFSIAPGVTYLNHGSFGPSPTVVQAARERWSAELEGNPMDFLVRRLEDHLQRARERLGQFLGSPAERLIFVENATYGMNLVAASVPLEPGDEVLANDHEYGAVLRIWRQRCQAVGANLVIARLPEPLETAEELVDALFAAVTPKTRLMVVSHVTSPTAAIFPVAEICRRARSQGIVVCVDGPHAPAAVSLSLRQIDADFYTASCHKWLAGPFGTGFLYVHPRWHARMRPVVVSWGGSLAGRDPHWHDEFNWPGTRDPAAFLALPAAIDYLEQFPGEGGALCGLPYFRQRSLALVRLARQQIAAVTGGDSSLPDGPEWTSTMITMPLPDHVPPHEGGKMHPLQTALWERYRIEVPIVNWHDRRWIRVSAHLYNHAGEIAALAEALRTELARRDP